jgi:hypothetical protein
VQIWVQRETGPSRQGEEGQALRKLLRGEEEKRPKTMTEQEERKMKFKRRIRRKEREMLQGDELVQDMFMRNLQKKERGEGDGFDVKKKVVFGGDNDDLESESSRDQDLNGGNVAREKGLGKRVGDDDDDDDDDDVNVADDDDDDDGGGMEI